MLKPVELDTVLVFQLYNKPENMLVFVKVNVTEFPLQTSVLLAINLFNAGAPAQGTCDQVFKFNKMKIVMTYKRIFFVELMMPIINIFKPFIILSNRVGLRFNEGSRL